MIFVYCENDLAKRLGLSRRALNRFRSEQLKEDVHWSTVTHESRKKTALSDAGVDLLVGALQKGALTGGEPVTIDLSEIKKTARLGEMPTGSGNVKRSEDSDQKTDGNSEKKPRAVIGLLPAPPGCSGSPLEAVLIVHRHPDTVPNKRTLICKLKPGQMPPHHENAVIDERGTAYCRVKSTDKFIVGMEIPARFDGGNVWDITRPCPRRKGKW